MSTNVLRTGDHILSLSKIPNKDVFRSSCSCGNWSRLAYPRSKVRELHRLHFEEVTRVVVPEPHMFALSTEGE